MATVHISNLMDRQPKRFAGASKLSPEQRRNIWNAREKNKDLALTRDSATREKMARAFLESALEHEYVLGGSLFEFDPVGTMGLYNDLLGGEGAAISPARLSRSGEHS